MPVRADSRFEQQGNWIAFLGEFNPQRRELWRIRDGDWHIDINLGADVPYDDAVSIVHAIRQKQLVDRRPPSREKSSEIRYVDPSAIRGSRPPKTWTVGECQFRESMKSRPEKLAATG